jgi:hypothetical protein
MKSQSAQRVIMVRPLEFSSNLETLVDNAFQSQSFEDHSTVSGMALQEFDRCVRDLRANDIDVIVLEPLLPTKTPDAVFPNNWFSIGHDGTLHIFSMATPSRRAEIRPNFDKELQSLGIAIKQIQDWSFAAVPNQFLEGTGSLVLDHQSCVAYVALSGRSNLNLATRWCEQNNYAICAFETFHNQLQMPVYHTNVVLSLGTLFAVVCLDVIHPKDRDRIHLHLTQSHRKVIPISLEQMNRFAGNILELQNKSNKKIIAMSQSAYQAFDDTQIQEFARDGELVICDIPTIEKFGGGSLRCMLAEVFV